MEIRDFNFIILANRRTGSHLLQSTLDKHPDCNCNGEVLLPLNYSYSSNRQNENNPETISGFILHRNQMRTKYQRTSWSELTLNKNLKIIDLRRRNLLKRFLSQRILEDSKKQISSDQEIELLRSELIADFNRIKTQEQYAEKYFNSFERLSLFYEEDIQKEFHATIRRVQKFLGLNVIDLEPQKKQNPSYALNKKVTNFDSLQQSFFETEWSTFFNPDNP